MRAISHTSRTKDLRSFHSSPQPGVHLWGRHNLLSGRDTLHIPDGPKESRHIVSFARSNVSTSAVLLLAPCDGSETDSMETRAPDLRTTQLPRKLVWTRRPRNLRRRLMWTLTWSRVRTDCIEHAAVTHRRNHLTSLTVFSSLLDITSRIINQS